MDTISFDKLLLKTAFCCMAADGNIDDREISLIKSMCEKSPLFTNFNFKEEINQLVGKINSGGKTFIQYYFDLLKQTQLNEEEELTLIDFAIQTINADEQIEYSEIKFFKNIRHRLNVSDEKILARFPDIEQYLEEKYGPTAVSQGLEVTTTLDVDLQRVAEATVNEYALKNEKNFHASNAALVALDPKTGQILSMVGSRDYFDTNIDGNYNIALAKRQPGSSFKPFVYATAIAQQHISPCFEVYDQPVTIPGRFMNFQHVTDWTPKNSTGTYSGARLNLKEALKNSVNSVSLAPQVYYLSD